MDQIGLGQDRNNRDAKYYRITKAGLKALNEGNRWRKMSALVEKP